MEPRPGLPILTAGNRAGRTLATAHLDRSRAAGASARISGPARLVGSARAGLGWAEALDEAGLPCDESMVVRRATGTQAAASWGLRTLLERHPDIDAVVAGNDQMALGVLRAARLAGRRVPDDLAVVGFDNIPESAYFWPPLTTVDQHLRDVGSEAVRLLNQLIDARLAGEPAPEPGAAAVGSPS